MKKNVKKQREFVFFINGVPHNLMMDEDALEEKPILPPDALEKLIAGELRAGTVRRLRDELLGEAIRQDRPEALSFLLPMTRKLAPEDFDALFRRTDGSPDIRTWLLAYRREYYSNNEWETWEQRKLDLELGFADLTLAEFKRIFKVSFVPGGMLVTGVKKAEWEYRIPTAVEGKPVVGVNAAVFHGLSPIPSIHRDFEKKDRPLPELACAKPGDTILLGRRAEKNAAERPIPWRIVQREKDQILLLCEEAVAALPYHAEMEEISWERCTLRHWLNDIFLPLAFAPEERALIVKRTVSAPGNPAYGTPGGADTADALFLPAADELREWQPEEKQRALGRWYWTRTPGYDNSFALAVTPDGAISKVGTFVDAEDYGVRPTMWIKA